MISPRFSASPPLGRLCRWLRTLGYDCIYLSEEVRSPAMTTQQDDRIYLTRHVDPKRRGVIFIGEDKVSDQLFIMNLLVSLKEAADPLSRCIECNEPLADLPREAAAGRVPEHVFITHHEFTHCPRCGRVFWPGTHVNHMEDMIGEIFG